MVLGPAGDAGVADPDGVVRRRASGRLILPIVPETVPEPNGQRRISGRVSGRADLGVRGGGAPSRKRPIPGRPEAATESHDLTVRNRNLSEETRTVPPLWTAWGIKIKCLGTGADGVFCAWWFAVDVVSQPRRAGQFPGPWRRSAFPRPVPGPCGRAWCDDRNYGVRRRSGRRCRRRRWSWCGGCRVLSPAVRAARGQARVSVVSAPPEAVACDQGSGEDGAGRRADAAGNHATCVTAFHADQRE